MRTLLLLPIFLLCSTTFASEVHFVYWDIWAAEPLSETYMGWSTSPQNKSVAVDWSRAVFGEHKGTPFLEVPLEGGRVERKVSIKTDKGIFYSTLLLVASPIRVQAPFDFLVALVEAGKGGRAVQCQIAEYSARKSADAKGPTVVQDSRDPLGQPIECRFR